MPPEAPYYAVIFTSVRSGRDAPGYDAAGRRMLDLAAAQPGYLGVASHRDPSGRGVTISYWESREAIAAWRAHLEHLEAQQAGRDRWYSRYRVEVCRVERCWTYPPDAP